MLTNIPKLMHFYWSGDPLSYLNFMTIVSFHKFNPDWEIMVHVPTKRSENITWLSKEQKTPYNGPDYWSELMMLDYINYNIIDFKKIGFNEELPEVFKSDYLRWYLLSTVGGGWSDMDILYIKSLNELPIEQYNTFICFRGDVHIIGFYLSTPFNKFFKKIYDHISPVFNLSEYQTIGSTLVTRLYPDTNNIDSGEINHMNLPMDFIYPYKDTDLNKLFNDTRLELLTNKTIGVHWYNGSELAKIFNNSFNPKSFNINNTITEILKMIK